MRSTGMRISSAARSRTFCTQAVDIHGDDVAELDGQPVGQDPAQIRTVIGDEGELFAGEGLKSTAIMKDTRDAPVRGVTHPGCDRAAPQVGAVPEGGGGARGTHRRRGGDFAFADGPWVVGARRQEPQEAGAGEGGGAADLAEQVEHGSALTEQMNVLEVRRPTALSEGLTGPQGAVLVTVELPQGRIGGGERVQRAVPRVCRA